MSLLILILHPPWCLLIIQRCDTQLYGVLSINNMNVCYLDGLGGVGQPLLDVVQQHASQAQLVVFVQQPQ